MDFDATFSIQFSQSNPDNQIYNFRSFLTFPHFAIISCPQFLDEVDLRPGDLVLVSGGVLQSVALPFPGLRLRLGAGFGQLATKSFACSTLIASDQILEGGKGLPSGDEVATVVIQRLDFVMFDVIKSFLIVIFDTKCKTSRVLFTLAY